MDWLKEKRGDKTKCSFYSDRSKGGDIETAQNCFPLPNAENLP